MSDELYRLPLAEFTAARDALASRLRREGAADAAAAVRRARKPSVPAWAANQVVWRATDSWQRLQQASDELRRAHERSSTAEELRQVAHRQREALQACEDRAAQLLAEHGHAAGPAVLARVSATLLALAHGAAETPGRLHRELDAPGFETAAGLRLVERAGEPAPTGVRARVRANAHGDANDRVRVNALEAARGRQAASRRQLMKARARLASEDTRRHAAERDLERARQAYEEARHALEDAEREGAEADAALRELEDGATER